MHIHFSLSHFDASAWHGYAHMQRFLIEGLLTAKHRITTSYETLDTPRPRLRFLEAEHDYSWKELGAFDPAAADSGDSPSCWNESALTWARKLLCDTGVDVVYAHSGGSCLEFIEAGASLGLRCVYHIHDYDLFCDRRYMLDHGRRVCSGPDSPWKCFRCTQKRYAYHAQLASTVAAVPALMDTLPQPVRSAFRRYAYYDRAKSNAARRLRAIEAVDCFLATGDSVRRTLEGCGVPAAKVRILPHVITRPDMQGEPPPSPRRTGPLRIGYFGRLGTEKGVDLLARALARLRQTADCPFEWWIICNGNEATARRLQRLSGLADHLFRHVQLTSGLELRDALRQLDLAVFPSLWAEIGPLALLEALRQGVFSVASDSIGMKDAVEPGVSGYHFSAGDCDSLTRVLSDASGHPYVRGRLPRRAFIEATDQSAYIARLSELLSPPSMRMNRESLSKR